MTPEIAGILSRYEGGSLSAPVTLMQLLIETEDAESVRTAVADFARTAVVNADGGAVGERARELEALMNANSGGCERIAAMLRADVDSSKPAQTVEEGIAFCERLFDWSVQQSEEASVALYSLGNPDLLERATAEIVSQLDRWGVISADSEVLDIGCGIGRLLVALAPRVKRVVGIDVSAEMVKTAQRRCASLDNVQVVKVDGFGLAGLPDSSFDFAIAVDSFPYLRQSGYALVERFIGESARVLRPHGQLVILNYSYSEDDEADEREIRELARDAGFAVIESGGRPFELWDAVAFRLSRSDRV